MTKPLLKAKSLFRICLLFSHTLCKRAPGFAWEKLFINSQIKTWYVALLTTFYKTISHLVNQAKRDSLSLLPPTKKVIESQMLHGILIPITAHGVAPIRRSSAGWMPESTGRWSVGVKRRHPVTMRKASFKTLSMRRV